MAVGGLPKNAKEIPNFPGYYATPSGDIWSGPKKTFSGYRKLKLLRVRHNYLCVDLCRDNKKSRRWVHRLVLETFISPCPDGMECCHNNDVSDDNGLENLRWDTHSENGRDVYRNGRRSNVGEKNPSAKLNGLQVRIIRRLLELNTLTQTEIGNTFGVGNRNISCIKRGVSWR